jgi:hypothetical protein
MKKIIFIFTLAVFSFTAMSQTCGSAAAAKCCATNDPKLEVKGAETIIIQTNAYSAASNEIFKEKIPFLKGVKDFVFDQASSKVAVAYDPKKTTPDEIRAGIAKMGFNADQVAANEQARAKLPAECRTMPKTCPKSCGKH